MKRRILLSLVALCVAFHSRPAKTAELSQEGVLRAISNARSYLLSQQNGDGSWDADRLGSYKTGVTSLVVLSLINGGQDVDSPPIRKALQHLRAKPTPNQTYDASMMLMALAAAKAGPGDRARIQTLADTLQAGQIMGGKGEGNWGYRTTPNRIDQGDRSNGQMAVLALRDAVESGAKVDRRVWQRARDHWLRYQNADGGWGYSNDDRNSIGSMTVAGIASLLITRTMLDDDPGVDANGRPICCRPPEDDNNYERGIKWLEDRFTVRQNPARGMYVLYYLYGLERAGRLSGRRFFGRHDWYREGASFLLSNQSARGSWTGAGHGESDKTVGTALALLFLSKGLSPVLINKLKFGPRNPGAGNRLLDDDWNLHPKDVRQLTQLISGLPKWPKLVTTQVVDINSLPRNGDAAVSILKQSPILYLSGSENPQFRFTNDEVQLLRLYLDRGGFIFAVRNCASAEFDDGIKSLVKRLYPNGEAQIKKLGGEHPVFRAEYPLDPDSVELFGVDAGCRTTMIYSAEDLSCLWDKWTPYTRTNQPQSLRILITRATRIGVNVIAYVTGRKPPLKLTEDDTIDLADTKLDRVERGFLKIPMLRHEGGWDTAPKALRNLLLSLNKTQGVQTSTASRNVLPADPNVFRYPLVYMHGRHPFHFTRQERDQLKAYLNRGGLLFADACCGSPQFDSSFREFVATAFPDKPLKRIPADHPLFHQPAGFGHEIKSAKRRVMSGNEQQGTVDSIIRDGEPYLEGIEIDGRLAVIYSKYDISCALERQASVGCSGYLFEDALKLGINVVMYAMLQDAKYVERIEELTGEEIVH